MPKNITQESKTQEPRPIDGLTEGRIVHFVLPDGIRAGQHRPAIVVKVSDPGSGLCNLQVFMDGTNDGNRYAGGLRWATNVLPSEEGAPGTWHWIEKA